ncbi:MAG TPA: PQQ-binding-like beta-propeller repeat protein [Solirubrobacteraceae bacterium]
MRRRLRLPRLRSWRARIGALAGVLVVLGLIALGLVLYVHKRTGSVYHPNAPFKPEKTPTKPPPQPIAKFVWPFYGYTKTHRRYFPAPATMHPPFHRVWEAKESDLLEFPPVMSGARIFQLADDGVLSAISAKDGHIIWKRKLGKLSASTPAVVGGTVYVTLLSGDEGEGGRVMAVKAETGHTVWSHNLPSRSESSPLVDHGKVIFGTESGTVYALRASNGSTIWTYQAAGAVKASPTLFKGLLYFGDYAGNIQAISERTGRRIWISASDGAAFGSGTFYSTAAVAYGRVYLGNTDGRIYAYDARTGKLDWAVQTGAYVYASPAVTNAPGLGPTIYEGSYDGTFYALNARSGREEWTHAASGPISGSATIVGKVVYFSNLKTYRTTGLNITTGGEVFSINQGAFDPVISDGEMLYLAGYNTLYALKPVTPRAASKPRPAKSAPAPKGSQGASRAHRSSH